MQQQILPTNTYKCDKHFPSIGSFQLREIRVQKAELTKENSLPVYVEGILEFQETVTKRLRYFPFTYNKGIVFCDLSELGAVQAQKEIVFIYVAEKCHSVKVMFTEWYKIESLESQCETAIHILIFLVLYACAFIGVGMAIMGFK